MSRYWDFAASIYRLAVNQFATSRWLNDRYDEVDAGFTTVQTEMDLKAPLASPALTGTPTAPTAAVTVDSTQIATTAFVHDLTGSLSVGLPLQTGNSGKVLGTNGTSASWIARLPDQTSNANKALFSNGTTEEWRTTKRIVALPILQANSGYVPVDVGPDLVTGFGDTGLAAAIDYFIFVDNLYVAAATGANANVSSSTDGVTWTLRAMPSSKTWVLGSLAGASGIGVVSGATDVAVSADGITWSSSTVLPAGVTNVKPPIFVGSNVLVGGTSSTTYYTTTDFSSWSTRTFPATPSIIMMVGTTAFIRTGATQAYTSTDGVNWTSRTITNYTNIIPASDGSLLGYLNDATAIDVTTDGITWSSSGIRVPAESVGTSYIILNGVKISVGANENCFLYLESSWRKRIAGQMSASFNAITSSQYAIGVRGVLNGRWLEGVQPGGGVVAVVDPALSPTGLFAITG